jgi:hypothetical protein
MPKFTLISEHDDSTRTTVEFEHDFLPNVLMQMDMFLRGTGFVYDGSLSIEEWEDYADNVDKDENTRTETVSVNSRCLSCGLTDEQLGFHTCYDQNCPKRTAVFTTGKL